jgi:predicted nuclease of restriction endonuclease-like RecB superfamily
MCTLQMYCTENWKQIFPEIKLPGLVTNFYIHVSVSDLYIPTTGPQTQYMYSKIGEPIVGLYKSLTDT